MKKLMFVCSVVTTCACLFLRADDFPDEDESDYPYQGPRDCNSFTRTFSLMGLLADQSDIIAVGRVTTQDWSKVVIRVETAVWGCTNGQSVSISRWNGDNPESAYEHYLSLGFAVDDFRITQPTNNARVVFSVYSNVFDDASGGMYIDWTKKRQPDEVAYTSTKYRWQYDTRSWWHADRDNGVLLEHYTNVVQAVRVDRNWTNFVHLCRDGMFKESNRVKEDSYYHMRGLLFNGGENGSHYIYNDPLVLPEFKAIILRHYPHFQNPP